MSETPALDIRDFPCDYRARMIASYPVIAGMTRDEAYFADMDERDEAFERILAAKNLRRTHELFLLGDRAGDLS